MTKGRVDGKDIIQSDCSHPRDAVAKFLSPVTS